MVAQLSVWNALHSSAHPQQGRGLGAGSRPRCRSDNVVQPRSLFVLAGPELLRRRFFLDNALASVANALGRAVSDAVAEFCEDDR
eukprot:5366426-Pyramimonas_sp.AAC.1